MHGVQALREKAAAQAAALEADKAALAAEVAKLKQGRAVFAPAGADAAKRPALCNKENVHA